MSVRARGIVGRVYGRGGLRPDERVIALMRGEASPAASGNARQLLERVRELHSLEIAEALEALGSPHDARASIDSRGEAGWALVELLAGPWSNEELHASLGLSEWIRDELRESARRLLAERAAPTAEALPPSPRARGQA